MITKIQPDSRKLETESFSSAISLSWGTTGCSQLPVGTWVWCLASKLTAISWSTSSSVLISSPLDCGLSQGDNTYVVRGKRFVANFATWWYKKVNSHWCGRVCESTEGRREARKHESLRGGRVKGQSGDREKRRNQSEGRSGGDTISRFSPRLLRGPFTFYTVLIIWPFISHQRGEERRSRVTVEPSCKFKNDPHSSRRSREKLQNREAFTILQYCNTTSCVIHYTANAAVKPFNCVVAPTAHVNNLLLIWKTWGWILKTCWVWNLTNPRVGCEKWASADCGAPTHGHFIKLKQQSHLWWWFSLHVCWWTSWALVSTRFWISSAVNCIYSIFIR